jgi:hypothetical protein
MYSNNTFRLFVSSTFSDFNEERKILQTKVFPEIKRYCSSKKLIFQPIDLRWGINNEAQLDQKTLELCVNEVKFSKLNPHPNFLIMSGDRYGWIPLPYAVEKKEFETILDLIQNDEKEFLENWYILDKNQIPESYILKERKNEYKDNKTWEIIENNLINILQIAVNKSNLTDEKKNKYFQSATEAEVIEGVFKYLGKTPFQNKLLEKDHTLENKDYENVYAYIRNIKTIDNQKFKNRFIDENFANVNKFKKTLKNSIKEQNILEVNIHLKNAMQSEENASLNYKYETIENEESIFEKTMIKFLKSSIDKYIKEELKSYEQERFKNDKLKDFLDTSRTKALAKIEGYLSSTENKTLVIHGKSGLGKSSLIAKAIQNTEYTHRDKKIIYRFVGSSANLSNTTEILISILKELEINEEIRKVTNNPQTMKEESEKFEEFCYRIQEHLTTLKNDIIIFIDAIDQLSNKDEFLWLPKNLPINLKIIISALDDRNYEEDSKYFQNLKNKTDNLYQLEEFDETYAEKLVLNILKKYNRTITQTQMNYLLGIYRNIKTPLYLSVAIQELIYWKSSDDSQILATSQKRIIEEFINNLTKFYHHDKELVKGVFNYLYLSDGLSESELLEILSTDEKFINYIAPETYHENVTKELPIIVWVRLHSQIKEFLRLEQKDNQETISFFHREFNDVIKNQKNIKNIHIHLIELIQQLIIKHQDKEFNSNRFGLIHFRLFKNFEQTYNILDNKFLIYIGQLNTQWLSDYILNINLIGEANVIINLHEALFCYNKSYSLLLEIIFKNENPKNQPIEYSILFFETVNKLAYIFIDLGQYNDAIKLYQPFEEWFDYIHTKLIYNDSNISSLYYSLLGNIMHAYTQTDKITDSLRILNKLKELTKNSSNLLWEIELHHRMGQALARKKDFKESLEEYNESLLKLENVQNEDFYPDLYLSTIYNLSTIKDTLDAINNNFDLTKLKSDYKILYELVLQFAEEERIDMLSKTNYINYCLGYAKNLGEKKSFNLALNVLNYCIHFIEEGLKQNYNKWIYLDVRARNILCWIKVHSNNVTSEILLDLGKNLIIILDKLHKNCSQDWITQYFLCLSLHLPTLSLKKSMETKLKRMLIEYLDFMISYLDSNLNKSNWESQYNQILTTLVFICKKSNDTILLKKIDSKYSKVFLNNEFLSNFNLNTTTIKISRNDSCSCGSGKKYKKCCGK